MKSLAIDSRGAVMVEAAIALPVLVALLLGMAEFGEAFTARRKAAQVANTAADLVAQTAGVSDADLADIAAISTTILKPYSTSGFGLRISSVAHNPDDTTTVQWSFGYGTTSRAAGGAAVAIPAGLIDQGQTIIVSEATYVFKPAIGTFLVDGVTFSSSAYFRPRLVSAVTKN